MNIRTREIARLLALYLNLIYRKYIKVNDRIPSFTMDAILLHQCHSIYERFGVNAGQAESYSTFALYPTSKACAPKLLHSWDMIRSPKF